MLRRSIVSRSYKANQEHFRILNRILFNIRVEPKQCQNRSKSIYSKQSTSASPRLLLGTGENQKQLINSRRWFASDLPPHTRVALPALSPTMERGTLISWEKKEGDKLEEGDLLAEIETDKATMGFETPDEGYLAKIIIQGGTKDIPLGKLLCIIVEDKDHIDAFKDYVDTSDPEPKAKSPTPESKKAEVEKAAAPPKAAEKAAPAPASEPAAFSGSPVGAAGRMFASPMARRLAAEKGLDLGSLDGQGTGPGGRIVATDLSKASAGGASAAVASNAEYQEVAISGMRQVIAKRLLESKTTIPHYYLTVELEVDELLRLRTQVNESLEGQKLSVNDFVIKAAALSCMKVPETNSSWQNTFIRQYNSVDMSIAVSTEAGLLTPIVFGAEKQGLLEINNNVKELAKKAREGKLQPKEFQGGTFTISNLGMYGIKSFSAVINPPQACILAVGGSHKTLVYDEQTCENRVANIMTVTLSCDHRVVDGAVGAQWLQHFKRFMEKPITMVL